jgi:hypothetical protein
MDWYRDMPPGPQIVAVDQRVQVTLDRASACVTLSGSVVSEGTIVDTAC